MIARKQARLDRFEGRQAVLRLENGGELAMLKEELGEGAKPGDAYVIQILPENQARLEQEALARTLLNELIHEHETGGTTNLAG